MLKSYLKNSILIFMILFILFFEKVDYSIHSYKINNTFKNDTNISKTKYVGYIEIKRLNIKREIKQGINNYNMIDSVTMHDNCKSLECDNIILAGHAIKNIFGNLKSIKENDYIKLYNGKDYNYQVISVDIVDKKNTSIIDKSDLILITCLNLNERIIVKAKRI